MSTEKITKALRQRMDAVATETKRINKENLAIKNEIKELEAKAAKLAPYASFYLRIV